MPEQRILINSQKLGRSYCTKKARGAMPLRESCIVWWMRIKSIPVARRIFKLENFVYRKPIVQCSSSAVLYERLSTIFQWRWFSKDEGFRTRGSPLLFSSLNQTNGTMELVERHKWNIRADIAHSWAWDEPEVGERPNSWTQLGEKSKSFPPCYSQSLPPPWAKVVLKLVCNET